ncbi:LysR family transcriptional regulator [Streptomyces sp. NPDC058092]|uniref:helix-turn-helix domain-containing protein n=1 Tax=Streptomyces sp. NPDC058092 TaxID=3346336 RepID=UPI0036E9E510
MQLFADAVEVRAERQVQQRHVGRPGRCLLLWGVPVLRGVVIPASRVLPVLRHRHRLASAVHSGYPRSSIPVLHLNRGPAPPLSDWPHGVRGHPFGADASPAGLSATGLPVFEVVSQPALSQTVSGLERQLGVKLLVRRGTGVRPTEAGDGPARRDPGCAGAARPGTAGDGPVPGRTAVPCPAPRQLVRELTCEASTPATVGFRSCHRRFLDPPYVQGAF